MGFQTLAPNSTITSSWGNGEVRNQVISQFASYSALTSAIGTPVKGMMAYTSDTDQYFYYKGTSWRLVPGQILYAKRDNVTTFFTNQAQAVDTIAFTSPAIALPNTGVGQAYKLDWALPLTNGAFATGRFNSKVWVSANGGAFTALASSGVIWLGAVDTWVLRGSETYKAANTDTSIAVRLTGVSSGGNFDCVAATNNVMHLRVESTGLLSTEVV